MRLNREMYTSSRICVACEIIIFQKRLSRSTSRFYRFSPAFPFVSPFPWSIYPSPHPSFHPLSSSPTLSLSGHLACVPRTKNSHKILDKTDSWHANFTEPRFFAGSPTSLSRIEQHLASENCCQGVPCLNCDRNPHGFTTIFVYVSFVRIMMHEIIQFWWRVFFTNPRALLG